MTCLLLKRGPNKLNGSGCLAWSDRPKPTSHLKLVKLCPQQPRSPMWPRSWILKRQEIQPQIAMRGSGSFFADEAFLGAGVRSEPNCTVAPLLLRRTG